ncbi:MAG TPA: hypothetical protein VF490_11740 [Chryseosolibacter sp.]
MDKTAVLQALALSEKNRSLIKVKTSRSDKPVIGAVQKILSHIVILKSPASEAVTVTFADIESVIGFQESGFRKAVARIMAAFP